MTFAVRRARQQWPRLLLVLLAGLVVVAGVGGMEGLSTRLVDDGLGGVAGAAEPGTRAATVTALRAADPAEQDRAVRAAIAKAFTGAPVAVSRLSVSEISLGNPDAVQAIGGDAVADRGRLIDGVWPSRGGEAAVLAAAAERRGWRVGDRIPLGTDEAGSPVEVAVVGIWRAADPADPRWAGDPAVASGDSGGAAGPVLVGDADMTRLWTTPTVTWTILPTALQEDRLDRYRAGLARLAGLPASVDPDSRSNTAVGGGLGDLLDRLTGAVAVARGTTIVPITIVVVLGAITIAVILGAIAGGRREELRLLRARGASGAGIAGGAAAEAAIAAGAGAAIALLALLPVGAPGPAALAAALLTVLAAAVVAGLLAARASVPAGATRSDAGRGIVLALLLPALLVALLAGFAVWQLFARGGVLTPGGAADPVASAAGAASLLALAMLVPVLAVLLSAVAERPARRSRGIMPVLPLRQVARRAGLSAVAILSLALAAGSATLAYGAGPLAAAADASALRAAVGLDVRVSAGDPNAVPLSAGQATDLPSATRTTAVLSADATVGQDRVPFLGADPAALPLSASLRSALGARSGGALPVAITAALAHRLGARSGTRFTAALLPDGTRLPAVVVMVVPALAGIGSGPGILADRDAALTAAGDAVANELWIAAADPAAVAAAIRSRASIPVRILTPPAVSVAPVTRTSTILLALGAAAAVLLGLLGFLAAIAADRARRTDERRTLRALGLSAARQRRARFGEVLATAVFGILGGVAAGLAVTAAVLPTMWGSGS
ncbi:hypothetical protein [Microbacterium sp. 22242]|uniref:hypothetical protein n=1 Tax=Microbacterium sp. 22242 TaxID=3453896 RepID=UPI003F832456